MADIATVFGWMPSAMDPMSAPELMGWRTKAVKRHNPES